MRRSIPFALLLLAGCASPAARPPAPGPAPAIAPQPSPEAAAAPPAVTTDPIRPPAASGDMVFDAWAAEFYGRAVKAGIAPALLQREMAGLTPDPRITSRDSRQPEFSQPVSAYIAGAVTDGPIAIGMRKRTEVPSLGAIEQRYGVPREILIGIWSRESAFGAIQGDFDVVRSMASLAAQGR